ncbi:hypothetical protein K2Z83_12445 [Oscillochloris sp. ZM17-4]|uniref:hypothetical protein n=1 Tax=Oscillochloris sp. ZM17-4 TaxID=2866714 RepID=UPI001C7374FE|nr:hypothetical protein [Oscillochloris sp. ZM17-4]MBX0328487.1 hypothetical protein [Oscillochloris sp. ZM17-4]
MLTYENFVSILLTSIEQAGLNIAYTQELIDTHALGRSLSITCLPDGIEDDHSPQEPALRAVVAFRWSPEFTVFSLRGADSLDNIERFVDERLFAHARSGPSLDVEVTYHIPLRDEQQRDVSALPVLARSIQEIHEALADPDDMVRVTSQLLFLVGQLPRIESLSAQRVWSIDDALYDPDLLSAVFEELCSELHAMLELLFVSYGIRDESGRSSGADSLPIDRQYLKPPTA